MASPRSQCILAFAGATLFFLLTLSTSVMSGPLENWHWRNPKPQGNPLYEVTYGNGLFVAVGYSTILTSTDGKQWKRGDIDVTGYYLSGLTYGNDIFVAVGWPGTAFTSQDGITWTQEVFLGEDISLNGVTYGNGTFVAVGFDAWWPASESKIFTSPDGKKWTKQFPGTYSFYPLYDVTYANDVFVAVGEGQILTSYDGVTWSRFSGIDFLETYDGIAFGGGIFVATTNSGNFYLSQDGFVWARNASWQWQQKSLGITYGNGTFVSVGITGAYASILTSKDGATWVGINTKTPNAFYSVVYGNGLFVAVGENGIIFNSCDGTVWDEASSGASYDFTQIIYAEGTYFVIGNYRDNGHGVILTSPDGIKWKETTLNTRLSVQSITRGKDLFVAVGGGGNVLTSPNGITWSEGTSGTTNGLLRVIYANNKFVAVGLNVILTSLDGIGWRITSSEPASLYGIAYGNGLFVAVGDNYLFTSPDGESWTRINFDFLPWLHGITYANGIFVAAGYEAILTSSDGINWKIARHRVCRGVAYGGGVFIVVGDMGKFWLSSSGEEWEERSTWMLYNYNLLDVIYADNTFIAVGTYGTIIQTDRSSFFEFVSSPDLPTGTKVGVCNRSYTYSTGGSESNFGHEIEYLFDWGDGSYSDWLPAGTTSAKKNWQSAGTYWVRAVARCSMDSETISGWSQGLLVAISESFSLESPANDQEYDACSLYSLPRFSWTVRESFKSFELQFSADSGFSSLITSFEVSATIMAVSSDIWKKMLSSPGAVYWRVIGTRPDGTKATSPVRSFRVESPQPVGGPDISPTSKSTLPTLSLQNNCNIKFKVWFGNDSQFSKKSSLSFKVKNPTDNGGTFTKLLTLSQWRAIRKVAKDISGSIIYWYVESWDVLGNYLKTDVMSFVLTE